MIEETEPGGYLPGSSEVTLRGDFTYRIDMAIPAGRASMQPGVSLVYSSSSGGSSLTSVGWSLDAGLSEIAPCHRSITDPGGTVGGVNFESTDQLCLDGNKMRLHSGVYGQVGSEYRLERDTFSKIEALGNGEGTPEHFRVWTKDLRILDYEAVNATRVHGSPNGFEEPFGGGVVRYRWLLREARDRSGNVVRYHYTVEQDNAPPWALEVRPSFIEYTRTVSGEASKRIVSFEYEPRPDTGFWYESGVRTRSTKRLHRVAMYAPNPEESAEVWSYELGYKQSPTTGRSLLTSIKRCDTGGACLWSKQFSWADAQRPDFDVIEITNVGLSNEEDVVYSTVLDVDGDGRDDLLYTVNPDSNLGPSTFLRRWETNSVLGKSTSLTAAPSIQNILFPHSRAGDQDGDGTSELFMARGTGEPGDPPPGHQLLRFDPAQGDFTPVGPLFATPPEGKAAYLLDLDGDGRLDVLRSKDEAGPDHWHVHWNTGGTSFGAGQDTGLVGGPFDGRALDLDGDGRSELLVRDPLSFLPDYHTVGLDDQQHMVDQQIFQLLGNVAFQFADLNGDGLRDLLFLSSGYTASVRYNTGHGFGPVEDLDIPGGFWPPDDGAPGVQVGDIDGDGREDLVTFSSQSGTMVHLARGAEFESVDLGIDSGHESGFEAGWTFPKVGDFNGDGLLDVVLADVEVSEGQNEQGEPVNIIQSWIRVLQQRPGAVDVVIEVWDEHAGHPRETVTYERIRPEPAPGDCGYPARCIRHGLEVVREHRLLRQDVPAAERRFWYDYEDARVDARGGSGFLGFGKVTQFDTDAFSATVTELDHHTEIDGIYPYAGLPAKVTTIVPLLEQPSIPTQPVTMPPFNTARARVTEVITSYSMIAPASDRYFVVPFTTSTTEWEQDAELTGDSATLVGNPYPGVRASDGTRFHDLFGNLVVAWNSTEGGSFESVVNTYDNLEADWQIGLLLRTSVVSGNPGELPPPRVTEYLYDPLGRLVRATVEPDNPLLRTSTIYQLDDYGLVRKITGIAPGVPSRHVYFDYDTEGVFLRAAWNDLAHYTRFVHHPALGAPVLVEDPNGVQTSATFDGLGRIRSRSPDGGMHVEWTYGADERATPGHPTGTFVTSLSQDGAIQTTYYDDWERPWEKRSLGFDGQVIVRQQLFNRFGEPARIYRAGFSHPSGALTETTFDALGRPVRILNPDGGMVELEHGLFETHRWDAMSRESWVHYDANGRVDETRHLVDGDPLRTRFFYGAFGQIDRVRDTEGHETQLYYDQRGRRTSLIDLDLGTIETQYNGFDEVDVETRPTVESIPQVRTYVRDVLGRVTQISSPDGLAQFDYDEGPGAKGKLTSSVSIDGVQTTHKFDDFGRPQSTTWTIGDEAFEIEQDYDPLGRLSVLRYPEVAGQQERFGVRAHYNGYGYLDAVKDDTLFFPPTYWQVDARNADDLLDAATFGNGVSEKRTYDPVTGRPSDLTADGDDAHFSVSYDYDLAGNVTSRSDAVAGRTETYGYDDLDRLTTWQLDVAAETYTTKYEYDRLGNLTKVFKDGLLAEVDDYGQNSAGPHALTTRTLTGQTPQTYGYDPRGRQDSAPGRTIQYADFDLPRWIGTDTSETLFLYDAFGTRVSKTSGPAETITIAGLYERRATDKGVQHVFYVHGDGGPVVEVVYDEAAGGESPRGLHRDALGSVGLISEKDGTEAERSFYDPFGLRVDSVGLPDGTAFSVPLGFTGHRHDDELGLIDMKGRIYDPSLRRFLTPDPLVPEPLFGQAYNRYSYVHNNPLRYTDPTGFLPDEWRLPSAAALAERAAMQNAESPEFHTVERVKRKPGATTGPASDSQPAASGEASDSQDHSAPTGATAQPTKARSTGDRVLKLAEKGVDMHPVLGPVKQSAELVRDVATAGSPTEAAEIIGDFYLDQLRGAANQPVNIAAGTLQAAATLPTAVEALNNAEEPEDKILAAITVAEKVAQIGAAAYGTVKGVQGAAGSARGAANSAGKATSAASPYKRPSGATTPQQRAAVQGQPCVDCGAVTPKQVADHKTPLVQEYYETGDIDKSKMRSPDAVQPQCPTCSARQGAKLSRYSREMKERRGQ